jgi:hypothetical protein
MIDMGRLPLEGREQPTMGHRRFALKLYYQLSLDRPVPQKNLLRRIAEVIDFSFVYPLARPLWGAKISSVSGGLTPEPFGSALSLLGLHPTATAATS